MHLNKSIPKYWLIPLFFALTILFVSPLRAQQAPSEVVVIEANGPVIAPFAEYISRGITEADERNAEAVLLVLDTPGGQVNLTLDLVSEIRNSDVPVIVYVGPPGAGAASAGLLITLAGHAAVMAPDTAIGASSPISSTGEDLETTADEKAREFLAAEARALAERRGEAAVEIANDAVFSARAVSFREAEEAGLIDFIANDYDEVLEQVNGFEIEVLGRPRVLNTADAVQVPIEMTWLERLFMLITDPNIVALLLAIGPLMIIVEIRTPGGWVAGVLGVICTGLALYGLGVLPVNWLGIVFIILALVMFVLEVTTPTNGILAAAGVASTTAGLIILFSSPEIEPFGELSIPLVVSYAVFLGALFAGFSYLVIKGQRSQITTGREGLVGKIGRVTRDIDPIGQVLVWGERWSAESSDGAVIPEGREIEVVDATGTRLIVRQAS